MERAKESDSEMECKDGREKKKTKMIKCCDKSNNKREKGVNYKPKTSVCGTCSMILHDFEWFSESICLSAVEI